VSRKSNYLLEFLVALFVIGLISSIAIIKAVIIYDDWTCAFSHCVKVK